jgi:alkanesulfonate monooxygenase SsuD/methylene tetrahydromethanopterin reductase-like flavin-dependent oxidoreductase (luciferase family)
LDPEIENGQRAAMGSANRLKLGLFGANCSSVRNRACAADPATDRRKEFVTADHIGEGRFGLNVVCGWNEGEFEMFGATLRDHEARYEYAQEWLDIVKLAWSPREDFDFAGQFFTLKGVRAKPKPYGGTRPLIMNAGASATGQAFATQNCDALFSTISRGISWSFHAAGRSQWSEQRPARQLQRYGQYRPHADPPVMAHP